MPSDDSLPLSASELAQHCADLRQRSADNRGAARRAVANGYQTCMKAQELLARYSPASPDERAERS